MEEKKSHTKNERSLPDHEEQELWFSALVADDSCAYNVDKAFDRFVSRTQQKRVRFSIFLKSFIVRQRYPIIDRFYDFLLVG